MLHRSANLLTKFQFIERYNLRNDKRQGPQPQPTHARKTPAASKPGRRNIDDTDIESEDDDCQQISNTTNSWSEEWKLYLNTHEVVPDDMGIVHWWGVGIFLSFVTANCLQVTYNLGVW
jgi:hypothetical protein